MGHASPRGSMHASHFPWRECFLKQPELHTTGITKWRIIRAVTILSEKMRQVLWAPKAQTAHLV